MAQASNNIYDSEIGYDHYWELNDVVVAHQRIEDEDLIILRGTKTAQDCMRDAEAIPVWHDKLGFCHSGFLLGMDEVFAEVRKVVNKKVRITGHSLGGARARILAALFVVNPSPCEGTSLSVCTFGSPKPGFINLARIIQKSGMEHSSYRNRNDIVPMVPAILPLWEHTEPWILLDASPDNDDFEPLRDHSSSLYVTGVEKLFQNIN